MAATATAKADTKADAKPSAVTVLADDDTLNSLFSGPGRTPRPSKYDAEVKAALADGRTYAIPAEDEKDAKDVIRELRRAAKLQKVTVQPRDQRDQKRVVFRVRVRETSTEADSE